MESSTRYIEFIRTSLEDMSTPEAVKSAEVFSPGGIEWVGVRASSIKLFVKEFHVQNSHLSADDILSLSEAILKHHKYSEEVFVAFALLDKFVKKNYDDDLLLRFEYWLENYASSWSHVDILCIKTIYLFLLARPHLIEKMQHWSKSKNPWCRRASNVVWVKFIKRKIGKSVYCLDTRLIFENCDTLLNDADKFVQKSIGWLLKVTSIHHQDDVLEYIRKNHGSMERSTIRYALEKFGKKLKQSVLQELK